MTNVITVASNERAVMSDFSIEDDYDTPAVDIADTTDDAIMNVTFNKMYFGNLYLNEVDNETYTAAKMVGGGAGAEEIDLTAYNATLGTWGDLTEVKKASDFTNKKATAATNGIFYTAEDGTVYAKITVPDDITRGTAYELIFDQTDVSSDDLGAKAEKENLNVTDSFVAPYVEAPAEIVVTSYANGTTTPKITMYNEDGDVLDWWTDKTTLAAALPGFQSMKFYSIDSNTASASDTASTTNTAIVEDGVVTLTLGTATANEYGYAKFVTTKGIFAAKSETLTSDVFEGAMAPMTDMTLAQDSSDPKAAKVTFKNLKGVADGTVYIFQDADSTDAATVKDVAAYDNKKAIGSAEIAGGTTSVVINDVFESVDTANAYKNKFVAVFKPNDTDLFKTVYNGGSNNGTINVPTFFTLAQKLTTYALVGDATGDTAIASTYKFSAVAVYDSVGDGSGTQAYLIAKDQFGDTIKGDSATPTVVVAATSFSPVASTFDGDAPAAVTTANTLKITTTGAAQNANAITLTQSNAAYGKALVKGNAVEATLTTGQKIRLTVDTADTTNGFVKFKLSIG